MLIGVLLKQITFFDTNFMSPLLNCKITTKLKKKRRNTRDLNFGNQFSADPYAVALHSYNCCY